MRAMSTHPHGRSGGMAAWSLRKETSANQSDPFGLHRLYIAPLVRRLGLSRLRQPVVHPPCSLRLRQVHYLVVKRLPLTAPSAHSCPSRRAPFGFGRTFMP